MIIELTVTQKNGIAFSGAVSFNTDDIVLAYNTADDEANTTLLYIQNGKRNKFVVEETIADINTAADDRLILVERAVLAGVGETEGVMLLSKSMVNRATQVDDNGTIVTNIVLSVPSSPKNPLLIYVPIELADFVTAFNDVVVDGNEFIPEENVAYYNGITMPEVTQLTTAAVNSKHIQSATGGGYTVRGIGNRPNDVMALSS